MLVIGLPNYSTRLNSIVDLETAFISRKKLTFDLTPLRKIPIYAKLTQKATVASTAPRGGHSGHFSPLQRREKIEQIIMEGNN